MTNRPIRVLELRSVFGTGGGPEKTILLSAARHNPADVAITVCYIRDKRDPTFHIDQRARQLGVDYVEVLERHSFDPGIWGTLRQLIREREIDILHAHEYKTDLLAWLLARATGTVPLSTAHGWSGQTRREWFYYYADKKLLARYPLVIAVSEQIRQTLIQFGAAPSKIRCVHNGVDHAVFTRVPGLKERVRSSLGIPCEAVVLGAIGRLEPEKRFELLLDAAAALAPDFSPMVVIAGEGSRRQALEQRARQLGIADRVKLLGHRHDVVEIHHAFDVYVQTSDREGLPNAVLEALAVGLPVIVTEFQGAEELKRLAPHRVRLVADTPTGIAAAIADCDLDPEVPPGVYELAPDRVARALLAAYQAPRKPVRRLVEVAHA